MKEGKGKLRKEEEMEVRKIMGMKKKIIKKIKEEEGGCE